MSQERMDIILGAVDEFSQEFDNFRNQLRGMDKGTDKSGKGLQKMGKSSVFLTGAIAGAGLAVGNFVTKQLGSLIAGLMDANGRMGAMAKEAQKVQITVEEMSQLAYIGEQTGVEIDDVTGSIEEMRMRMAEAAQDGTGPLATAFDKLGMNAAEMLKLPVSEQLGIIGDKLNGLNAADRQFLADEIFGGDAVRMMGFLAQGSEGIQELSNRADELGITMSNSGAAAAGEFNKAWKEMMAVITGIMDNLMGPVLAFAANVIRTVSSIVTKWDVAWELIVESMKLYYLTIWGEFAHLMVEKMPKTLMWFSENFVKIFQDAVIATMTIFRNLGYNIRDTVDVIWDYIVAKMTGQDAGDPFKKLGGIWGSSLLEGFQATTSEFPEFAERTIDGVEAETRENVANLWGELQADNTKVRKSEANRTGENVKGELLLGSGLKGVGKGLLNGLMDSIDEQDPGKGFVGSLTGGDGDRFLQTGSSVAVPPEEETAKNTERIKEEMMNVAAGIETLGNVFTRATGIGASESNSLSVVIPESILERLAGEQGEGV